jgi:two-component system CheB/CheR fusion protein
MVRDCILSVQGITSHHFNVSCPGDLVIKCDRSRLEQVMMNFINNAIKYSPDGSLIEITVSRSSSEIVCAIKDNGIGIPKAALTHLFNRFYRVQTTSSKFPGLGVGLYISNEIIKLHNGKAWVESEEGKGSTFFFSIPV